MATGSGKPPHGLREVAGAFLKLGLTAFGGPAAHIALMEEEFVRRRQWVTREEFLDLLAAVQLLPGPNSTEMALHLGHRRAGSPGLVVGGVGFILPAYLIVTALAWVYLRYGQVPQVGGVLYGVKPVVIAVMAQAVWGLGRTALSRRELVGVAAAALGAALAGLNEIAILGLGGLVALGASRGQDGMGGRALAGLGFLGIAGSGPGGLAGAAVASAISPAVPYTLAGLGWFFLKVGSVLFGSGYVLLAFLEADLVTRWGWLTRQQLLDAVAIGQFTPGPLFTTATFIGHLLGGFAGGAVATGAIFLPAFAFVALSGPLIPRLRRSARAAAFLDGVIAASLALMAGVTLELARAAVVDPATLALAAGAAVGLLRFRIQATWLLLAGAAAGLGLQVR